MPSFSKETIEAWRRERVTEKFDQKTFSNQQGREKMSDQWCRDACSFAIETIDEDIREETRRLDAAQRQVTTSLQNLAALKIKRKATAEYGAAIGSKK